MSKEDIFWRYFYYGVLVAGVVALAFLGWSIFGCNEKPPHSPDLQEAAPQDHKSEKVPLQANMTLSELSKPHTTDPKPYHLVGPSDENWLQALRIYETGENPWAVGDLGKSRGEYQIQEGRWNDALDRLGIDHDAPEWSWERWYWCRPKAGYVLYSYWARFKLKTWEQRIKAHKGIKGINNPSREVYYQRVKNIAYDLMRRKAVDEMEKAIVEDIARCSECGGYLTGHTRISCLQDQILRLQATVDKLPEQIVDALIESDKDCAAGDVDHVRICTIFGVNFYDDEEEAKDEMLRVAREAAEAAQKGKANDTPADYNRCI